MAKRFAYVSFGVLCLVAAYQLGAERAAAEWQHSGFVVGTVDGDLVWNDLGEAYSVNPFAPGWNRDANHDLPVPATDVKLLDGGSQWLILVTTTDEIWFHDLSGWTPFPAVPGGPVALPVESWGAVKGKYR